MEPVQATKKRTLTSIRDTEMKEVLGRRLCPVIYIDRDKLKLYQEDQRRFYDEISQCETAVVYRFSKEAQYEATNLINLDESERYSICRGDVSYSQYQKGKKSGAYYEKVTAEYPLSNLESDLKRKGLEGECTIPNVADINFKPADSSCGWTDSLEHLDNLLKEVANNKSYYIQNANFKLSPSVDAEHPFRIDNLSTPMNNIDAGEFGLYGIKTPWRYWSMAGNCTPFHVEDFHFAGVNYNVKGAPQIWIIVSREDTPRLFDRLRKEKDCKVYYRSKDRLVLLEQLIQWNIAFQIHVQEEGDMVVVGSGVAHQVYSTGVSVKYAINVIDAMWFEYDVPFCNCKPHAHGIVYLKCVMKNRERLRKKFENAILKERQRRLREIELTKRLTAANEKVGNGYNGMRNHFSQKHLLSCRTGVDETRLVVLP